MTLKESIQLGDIVKLDDGRTYIYLNCPTVGYSSTKNILNRPQSYFGNGLESFNDELYNAHVHVRIVEIRRPLIEPLTFLNNREDLDSSYFTEYIRRSVRKDLEENFINISLYV